MAECPFVIHLGLLAYFACFGRRTRRLLGYILLRLLTRRRNLAAEPGAKLLKLAALGIKLLLALPDACKLLRKAYENGINYFE